MVEVSPEPFFEPIGQSPENHATSPRWIVAFVVTLVVLFASVAVGLRLTGHLG